MAVSVMAFFNTQLGRELGKLIPSECSRIIVDVPRDGAVKIYYETYAGEALLNLSWENALSGAEVISTTQKVKG